MKHLYVLAAQLITYLAILVRPGGVRALVAENLLLKRIRSTKHVNAGSV